MEAEKHKGMGCGVVVSFWNYHFQAAELHYHITMGCQPSCPLTVCLCPKPKGTISRQLEGLSNSHQPKDR
jgi:hypothetical protein